jgi:hypothetical protein
MGSLPVIEVPQQRVELTLVLRLGAASLAGWRRTVHRTVGETGICGGGLFWAGSWLTVALQRLSMVPDEADQPTG